MVFWRFRCSFLKSYVWGVRVGCSCLPFFNWFLSSLSTNLPFLDSIQILDPSLKIGLFNSKWYRSSRFCDFLQLSSWPFRPSMLLKGATTQGVPRLRNGPRTGSLEEHKLTLPESFRNAMIRFQLVVDFPGQFFLGNTSIPNLLSSKIFSQQFSLRSCLVEVSHHPNDSVRIATKGSLASAFYFPWCESCKNLPLLRIVIPQTYLIVGLEPGAEIQRDDDASFILRVIRHDDDIYLGY